jgi:hypothetical protein
MDWNDEGYEHMTWTELSLVMVFHEHGHEHSYSTKRTAFCDYKKQLSPAKLRIFYLLGYYNQNYIKWNSDYW